MMATIIMLGNNL